jgi:hypothetical protein
MKDERGREKGASARRGKVWEMTGSLRHGLAGQSGELNSAGAKSLDMADWSVINRLL